MFFVVLIFIGSLPSGESGVQIRQSVTRGVLCLANWQAEGTPKKSKKSKKKKEKSKGNKDLT